jgi:hypothetical protein
MLSELDFAAWAKRVNLSNHAIRHRTGSTLRSGVPRGRRPLERNRPLSQQEDGSHD